MIIATRLPWVLIASGKMVDNMLQLMSFSVYFKGILNTDNGYFHIKIMISAGHMLGGSWACSLRKFLKKLQLSAF